MHPFINGLIFGFIFLLALGPAFFALIQTSIQQGFKKTLFLALGVSVSDTVYVVIVLFGFVKVFNDEDFKFWMAIFGSGMLIGYAIYSWFKTPVIFNEETVDAESNYSRNFFKGLFLNGLNPFIIISWATWVSTITVNFDYSFTAQTQFFSGMLICILSMDMGKAYIAHSLKHMITLKFVKNMNRSIAIILFLFTIRLIYYLVEN